MLTILERAKQFMLRIAVLHGPRRGENKNKKQDYLLKDDLKKNIILTEINRNLIFNSK